MHTLFDFVSNVNAMQYGIALLSVLGFIIFCEILKPRPFQGLLKSAAEDAGFLKTQSRERVARMVRNIALAPVFGVFYLAALPFLFVQGMAVPLSKGVSTVTSAGWSPVRAYFAGRKKMKKAKGGEPGQRI